MEKIIQATLQWSRTIKRWRKSTEQDNPTGQNNFLFHKHEQKSDFVTFLPFISVSVVDSFFFLLANSLVCLISCFSCSGITLITSVSHWRTGKREKFYFRQWIMMVDSSMHNGAKAHKAGWKAGKEEKSEWRYVTKDLCIERSSIYLQTV